MPTLQEIQKVFFLPLLLLLCKQLCGRHAQVVSRVEVENSHVEHSSGLPIPEYLGAYTIPRLFRYHYLSQPPSRLSPPLASPPISPDPLELFSVNVCPTSSCISPLCIPDPDLSPMYSTTID